MSDDTRDDEAPTLPDPVAEQLERECLGQPEPDEVEIEPPDYERVKAIEMRVIDVINAVAKDTDGVLYSEMLIALACAFSATAEGMMKLVEFDVFHENRNLILGILGRTSGFINRIYPTVEQLEQAKTETVH